MRTTCPQAHPRGGRTCTGPGHGPATGRDAGPAQVTCGPLHPQSPDAPLLTPGASSTWNNTRGTTRPRGKRPSPAPTPWQGNRLFQTRAARHQPCGQGPVPHGTLGPDTPSGSAKTGAMGLDACPGNIRHGLSLFHVEQEHQDSLLLSLAILTLSTRRTIQWKPPFTRLGDEPAGAGDAAAERPTAFPST